MQARRGVANLPLHGGHAPRWLFTRMVDLTEGILDVILYEFDQDEFLRRISDPHWFQAFSCVIGFDGTHQAPPQLPVERLKWP